MKKLFLSTLLLGAFVFLTACQESTPSSTPNENPNQESSEDISNESEKDNNDVEVLSPETSDQNKQAEEPNLIAKENLLDAPKKIKHPTKDIEITYTDAFFTMQVMPTNNPKDVREILAKDKEIYLRVIADMYNDTTDSFHFGNSLGDAKVKLIYDGKHEFDFYATAENSDGTKLGASQADALTTTKAHYYSKVPIAVYNNSDKPLELKITVGEEEYQVPLR